jgi:hypothetical protein
MYFRRWWLECPCFAHVSRFHREGDGLTDHINENPTTAIMIHADVIISYHSILWWHFINWCKQVGIKCTEQGTWRLLEIRGKKNLKWWLSCNSNGLIIKVSVNLVDELAKLGHCPHKDDSQVVTASFSDICSRQIRSQNISHS